MKTLNEFLEEKSAKDRIKDGVIMLAKRHAKLVKDKAGVVAITAAKLSVNDKIKKHGFDPKEIFIFDKK